MSIQIGEKSFIVTLTSNEFQDLFPNNTVSRFRAQLPAQYILPNNVKYKVALVKLLYRNMINNIGRVGANTQFFLSLGNDSEIYETDFPELQLNTLGEIVTILRTEVLKAIAKFMAKNAENAASIIGRKIIINAIASEAIASKINAIPIALHTSMYRPTRPLMQFDNIRNIDSMIQAEEEFVPAPTQNSVTNISIENLKEVSSIHHPWGSEHIPSNEYDEAFMSDAPAASADQSTTDHIAILIYNFIQDKINVNLPHLIRVLYDPFYTLEERFLKWKYFWSKMDYFGLQNRKALWERDKKRGEYPVSSFHVNLLEKLLQINTNWIERLEKINWFAEYEELQKVESWFQQHVTHQRHVLLESFSPNAFQQEFDETEQLYFEKNIKTNPAVILFELWEFIKNEHERAEDEEEKENVRNFESTAKEAYYNLVDTLDLIYASLFYMPKGTIHKLSLFEDMLSEYSILLRVKLYIEKTFQVSRKIPKPSDDEPQAEEVRSRPETTVSQFKTKKEWSAFVEKYKNNSQQSTVDFLKSQDIYNRQMLNYMRKVHRNEITRNTPTSELTPVEQYFKQLANEPLSQKRTEDTQNNLQPLQKKQKTTQTIESPLGLMTITSQTENKTPPPPPRVDIIEPPSPPKHTTIPTHIVPDISIQEKPPSSPTPLPKQSEIPVPVPNISVTEMPNKNIPVSKISSPPPPQSQTKIETPQEKTKKDKKHTPLLEEIKSPTAAAEKPIIIKTKPVEDKISFTSQPLLAGLFNKYSDFENILLLEKFNIETVLAKSRKIRESLDADDSNVAKIQRQIPFATMVPPEFEDNPNANYWNHTASKSFFSLLSYQYRFALTPYLPFTIDATTPERDGENFARLITIAESPALEEVIPKFIKDKDSIQNHMYYYLDFPDFNQDDQLIKTILRLNVEKTNVFVTSDVSNPDKYIEMKSQLAAKIRAVEKAMITTTPIDGKLNIPSDQVFSTHQMLNTHGVLAIHTDFLDFDFGMSVEFLALLGLTNEPRFLIENFQRRQQYRYWLNGFVRDANEWFIHDYFGIESLLKYFSFGKHDAEKENKVSKFVSSKAYLSKPDSLFPAEEIWKFGKCFFEGPDKLNLIAENAQGSLTIFSVYQYMITKLNAQLFFLVWASLIVRTKSKSITEVLKSIPQNEYREFMKLFYRGDPILDKKLEGGNAIFYPLNTFDIIIFMLWYCYKGMIFNTQLISKIPARLNPYTEFWIYSDIIQDEVVNRQFGKLLAMCTTPQNLPHGDQAEVTYNFPLFKNLNSQTLNEIEILIATRFGKPVPFIDGPSTVQLLFEVKE